MPKYGGLFVRGYMGDTGDYPKPASSSVWESPDIIPWGTAVCEDPAAAFLGSNFNKAYSNDVYGGIQNYVYVRGQNFSGGDLKGKMYLYYSDSTMLLAPSTWKPIPSSKEKPYISFAAGKGANIVCNSDDDGIFVVKPEKVSGHPCMISRIATDKYPAPIPDLSNITDFSIFLRSDQSMGYAQRNLRYVDISLPNTTIEEHIDNPFYTPITDAYVVLNLYGLPKNTEFQMTCPGSRSGCYIEVPKQKVMEDTYAKPLSIAAKVTNMPAGFSSPLYVYFWSNGIPVDYRFKIEVDFVSMFTPDSIAYSFGSPVRDLSLSSIHHDGDTLLGADVSRHFDTIGPRTFIRVGSCEHTAKR